VGNGRLTNDTMIYYDQSGGMVGNEINRNNYKIVDDKGEGFTGVKSQIAYGGFLYGLMA
jgi:hypothetical protein